jgi:predicted Zn-dependent protease
MELNHVMQKLAKEIGIATIISISSGSAGEMVMQTARLFTSGAYDRKLEKEADLEAVRILNKAGIDKNGLANFMERLSSTENNLEIIEWLSTHPDSKERAKYIRGAKH